MRKLYLLFPIVLLAFTVFCSVQLLLDGRIVITRSNENIVIVIERFLQFEEKVMLGFSAITGSFIAVTTLWFAKKELI